jgi:hypothetical protein
LVAVLVAVATVVAVLRQKSLAQAICVQRTSLLAADLGQHLSELLRLNPHARRLRHAHDSATAALKIARATGSLPGVVAALAWRRATEVAQVTLDLKQRALLIEAEATRLRHRAWLDRDLRPLRASRIRLSSPDPRALAVYARPPRARAPEYFPVVGFARRQAQSVRFEAQVAPALVGWFTAIRQRTDCVITLRKDKRQWRPEITAASAPSSWPSSP